MLSNSSLDRFTSQSEGQKKKNHTIESFMTLSKGKYISLSAISLLQIQPFPISEFLIFLHTFNTI